MTIIAFMHECQVPCTLARKIVMNNAKHMPGKPTKTLNLFWAGYELFFEPA